jgi:ferric-dicitrate binding protein FerR (iron transport regulator)
LATKLRKEFIKLLEKDPEFRQTVAGYLGLAETLKKLDQHLEELRSIRQEQQKTWQNIEKLWQEVRELRQDQTKLWEEVRGSQRRPRKAVAGSQRAESEPDEALGKHGEAMGGG